MTVTKTYCDRCHKQVIYPVTRMIHLFNREGEYDLCDICYDELYSWFKGEVLDKIRKEMEDAAAFDSQEIDGEHESLMLNIIDKYRLSEESEE